MYNVLRNMIMLANIDIRDTLYMKSHNYTQLCVICTKTVFSQVKTLENS